MIQNIEKVLDRGEQIQVILEAAEDLEDTAVTFRRGAKKLKVALLARMIIVLILIGFIICLVACAAVIFMIVFFCGFNFECLPKLTSSSGKSSPSLTEVVSEISKILRKN